MEPDHVQARAALLSQLGFQRERLLRELRDAVALSASYGIDIRGRVRQFLRSVAPELTATGPGAAVVVAEVDRVTVNAAAAGFSSDAEAVLGLYSELGDLALAGDQPAYGRTLRRLRQLQLRHAERTDTVLRAHLTAAAEEPPASRTPARARRTPAKSDAAPTRPRDPASAPAVRRRSRPLAVP